MLTTLVTAKTEYDGFSEANMASQTIDKRDARIQVDIKAIDDATVKDAFAESYYQALQLSTNSMLPTFSSIPQGDESGVFLAIDLGGSTLRIAIVEVSNQKTSTISEMSWLTKDNEKLINEEFFQQMSSKIKVVIASQRVLSPDSLIHCGVTWSFPLRQTAPNNGHMENMGKGYKLTPHSEGQDLKILLERACSQNGLLISVDAIINDSVSVFVAGKFLHNSKIGIVLGTGTNSSISMPQRLLSTEKRLRNDGMDCLLNTELSFFGYHLQEFATKFDHMLDEHWGLDFKQTPQPHMDTKTYGVFQPLELMTSGRYISELIRLEIVERCSFLSASVESLRTPYDLDAQLICDIYENEDFRKFESQHKVKLSDIDKINIKDIIDVVIERAVYVLGLAIVGLLDVLKESHPQDQEEEVIIGYVGSILQYFHSYRRKLEKFINVQQEKKVRFVYVENCSVNGAAIAAAVNNRE